MRINIITEDREKYMDILLLADPQEDMILKYLHQSDLFVLSEEGVIKTVCAVVRLNDLSLIHILYCRKISRMCEESS